MRTPSRPATSISSSRLAGTEPANGAETVDAIRAFNRFYTKAAGLLQRGLLESPYSLTEVRVLYELAHRKDLTATDLTDSLGIDPGYLSRILRRFEKSQLITRKRSQGDARSSLLRLTASGRTVFADLNVRQSAQVERMIESVPPESQRNLVASMRMIMTTLGGADTVESNAEELRLRTHRPGDMGWVMFTHGDIYAREYDWDERFEALVGEIVVNFIHSFDPERERCWIAELGDERVGSIFLVKDTPEVAKLRLLLVTPAARGRGVGKRLVDECIAFARQAGYRKLTLWTNDVL
ncbi:MAG TPA: helix-turn-helix domain-containing GNAT family N-acetyltransferase, partial [Gemmatimonadaceae bacterium]|nr:helix-turn-helix domain-containing GNAT family N-acetyltransferase [Gemmatimonadaceae bacterium]